MIIGGCNDRLELNERSRLWNFDMRGVGTVLKRLGWEHEDLRIA